MMSILLIILSTMTVWSMKINLSELQLNEASSSDIEAPFLTLHLAISISDGFVPSSFF